MTLRLYLQDSIFKENTSQTVGEVTVIPGHIVVVEGENGEAAVQNLFNGLVVIRNLRTEVDMDEEGVPARRGWDGGMEGEGERFAVKGEVCGDPGARSLAAEGGGTEHFPGEGKLLRPGRQMAVDLAVEDGEHLLPGKQRGKILCVHSISLSQIPIS